jgi:nitrate/nitrite-specific signal transduction histidine kinase
MYLTALPATCYAPPDRYALNISPAHSIYIPIARIERVQQSVNSQQHEQQQPIFDELREGLSSDYRQLRELLTTFRLKIEGGELRSVLTLVISQLHERSDLTIRLH